MDTTQVTTSHVAAQETCAFPGPRPLPGMGRIDTQPAFQPVRRRDLMAAVNTLGRDLGLRPASIMVLDALLSCLPCKSPDGLRDQPITPSVLLTVFASNDTLCYRAKGITDRQLRRHLERLEEVGLIRRCDSANGKRFPVYRGGKVVGAFGLDLSPLLARAQELLVLAERRREEAAELRGLKAQIQQLRAECLRLDLDEAAREFIESTRNLMRRAGANLIQAKAIIRKLTAFLSGGEADETEPASEVATAPCAISTPEPKKRPATDGRNVRHKEPVKPYTQKSPADPRKVPDLTDWSRLSAVQEFYPKQPRSEHGLREVIFGFGKMLGIPHNCLATALGVIGTSATLTLQDRIAKNIARISDPSGYFAKALRQEQARVGHGQLSRLS